MLTRDVLRHFGNNRSEVARALGISRSAVHQWDKTVPVRRQYELERITGGVLRAELPHALRRSRAA